MALAGRSCTPEMLERPQEAMFAEASRVLYSVATSSGEGHIDRQALNRAASVNSQKALQLTTSWFQKVQLLELYGHTQMRTAYDCAPKRYRAQFLCLINRLLLVESRHFGSHIRQPWEQIMKNFPELQLWRDFREQLLQHLWDNRRDPREVRSYADEARRALQIC